MNTDDQPSNTRKTERLPEDAAARHAQEAEELLAQIDTLGVHAVVQHGTAYAHRAKAHAELANYHLGVAAARGSGAYYRGVADAMDVIRAYDFPLTERVDHIADKLAPSSTSAQINQTEETR